MAPRGKKVTISSDIFNSGMRVRRAAFSGALALVLTFVAVAAAESNDTEHHDGATMLGTPAKVLGQVAKWGVLLVREIVKGGTDTDSKDLWGDTRLHNAAAQGRVLMVRFLLEMGADKDAKNFGGLRTALHGAAFKGHEEVVRVLLGVGADVSAKDVRGWTALHDAAAFDQEDMAQLLIEHGADVSSKNKHGDTPLDVAERWDSAAVARTLLAAGAKHGHTEHASMFLALIPDQLTRLLTCCLLALPLAAATAVISTGALYIHDRLQARSAAAATAAVTAAVTAVTAVTAALPNLEHMEEGGAGLTDSEQLTAYLFYAARSGHEAVVRLLLDSGVDISSRENDEATPLHHAAFFGHAAVVRVLLDKGADLAAKNINGGFTPEGMATLRSHLEVAAMLKAEGVRRAQCVAFGMGQLERLGAGSRVRLLDGGVVRMVLEQV